MFVDIPVAVRSSKYTVLAVDNFSSFPLSTTAKTIYKIHLTHVKKQIQSSCNNTFRVPKREASFTPKGSIINQVKLIGWFQAAVFSQYTDKWRRAWTLITNPCDS